jgi:hypothetical protein
VDDVVGEEASAGRRWGADEGGWGFVAVSAASVFEWGKEGDWRGEP